MAGKLTVLGVRNLDRPGLHGDGGGLYIQVRSPSRKSWVYRYKLAGRPRMMGLGAWPDVSLAAARELAAAARQQVRAGACPIEAREAAKRAALTERTTHPFRDVAEAYVAAQTPAWRNPKHRQQWANTLATYAYPVIGPKPVADITTADVLAVLEPVWLRAPETGSRLRGRIETILDAAAARGWRRGDNPARWRGHLAKLLPARGKVRRVAHHAALPWQDVPAFMAALAAQPGIGALALRFAVLTAARTGEVIGAKWDEVDIAGAVWIVPAVRMKAGREHRVPLPDPALALLRTMEPWRGAGGFIFPGARPGRGLSNMALLATLRRMRRPDLTAHGFRSTFRDWCAEATAYPAEIAEVALAHVVRDKVEAAYRRGDMFAKRRHLMDDWARQCAGGAAATGRK